MKSYAGIGSRNTPDIVLIKMYNIAKQMWNLDYLLRSGGANGADNAFEEGCKSINGSMEIYLPWNNYNGRVMDKNHTYLIPDLAYDIARKYHPAWGKLTEGAKKLMARNSLIILGQDLESPVDLVICWTKNGEVAGGTGQALRIAEDYNITILNLAIKEFKM